jgi:hypothetical protein
MCQIGTECKTSGITITTLVTAAGTYHRKLNPLILFFSVSDECMCECE